MSRDPQIRSAYAEFLTLTSSPELGFPRAVQIREWVPGLTPAHGAIAVTAVAAWMPQPAAASQVEQAIHTVMTTAMIAVTTGLPALSVWFGYHLARP
jgi:hypothetical protein